MITRARHSVRLRGACWALLLMCVFVTTACDDSTITNVEPRLSSATPVIVANLTHYWWPSGIYQYASHTATDLFEVVTLFEGGRWHHLVHCLRVGGGQITFHVAPALPELATTYTLRCVHDQGGGGG